MLTAHEIAKQIKQQHIIINPFDVQNLNPNSYNLHLGDTIAYYDLAEGEAIDLATIANKDLITEEIPKTGYRLKAGKLYLAKTLEYTETHGFIPQIDGRSSIGRVGLFVHVTAGFGDIGFKGYWTLEIMAVHDTIIYPYIELCQIYYHQPTGIIKQEYTGAYQNNTGIQGSKFTIDKPIREGWDKAFADMHANGDDKDLFEGFAESIKDELKCYVDKPNTTEVREEIIELVERKIDEFLP